MSKKEVPNINVVIIGHVDSGKSTTCGQLVANLGKIDKRTLEKYEKEANEMGKGSFKWAWVMDSLKNERERGITISTSLKEIHLKKVKATIIDAPGHRDFIKNMITGTSQADAAVLVISAAKGEFEAGISETGQTKEHAMLAQTLGIKQCIVSVNKMDTTMEEGDKNFSEKRFNEIKVYIKDFLLKLGFKEADLSFVPTSGFHGDNIIEPSARCAWYKEGTLADHLDNLKVPKRPTKKPLRLPVQSRYKIAGVGLVSSGRVETGVIRAGLMIVFVPGNLKAEVKSIQMHHLPLEEGIPGQNIGFNVKGVAYKSVKNGMVVGNFNDTPPIECVTFVAKVIIVKHNGEIKKGYSPVIHIHAAHVTCKITGIRNLFDRRTGKIIEEEPLCIKKDQGAMVEFTPEKSLVVEPFKRFPPLGRFSIRDSKFTVGVGVIMEVAFKE